MKASQVHDQINKYLPPGAEPIVVDLEKSHGPYLHDALTDRDYIDFFSYFASAPVGHNHPKMHDSSFIEKLLTVAITKPSSSDFYTVQMAEFVETFARIAMPADMRHLFLISGGALAVENGLKVAFDWKARKNFARVGQAAPKGQPHRIEGLGSKVIHFKEAFHGRSGYTLTLTNTEDPRKYMYFPKFDWPRVINPKLRFPITEEVLAEVKRTEEIAVAQIELICQQHPGDIAALIIETIQGEGGDNHFRPEFFAELRRLADKHEFLFVLDEIQCGMGITGKMWAIEHMGVRPDIIVFGKKAQVCGIIVGPRIDEVAENVFNEASRINSTWGGDLTDMVRAMRFLEIMEEDQLLDHTEKMGERLLKGLHTVESSSKGFVSNVRGRGMMVAFDVPDKTQRDEMLERMQKNGMYALASGNHSIRFRGMLDTPAEIIDKAVEIVGASLPN